ncbi:MAG TPA: ribbon-helix-helix protein, CopG family [Kribbella sp.]|jgi:predicted DNA-binding protein
MPLKVRLTPEAASALQAEAERSGRSQQEIVQEAVSRYLSIGDDAGVTSERALARAAQSVHAARVTYRKVTPRLRLRSGTTSLELLDRDDRF